MIEKAIKIAAMAHTGQKDKAGEPYIFHPLRVMLMCSNDIDRICGVLHDVIEDTAITLEYLQKEGFSQEVITALEALTKQTDENYDDFIGRVLKNEIACHVKLADLADNMDLSRLQNPSEEDFRRVKKYQKAVERIHASLKNGA